MSSIFPWRGKDKTEKTPSDEIRVQRIEEILDSYLSNRKREFDEYQQRVKQKFEDLIKSNEESMKNEGIRVQNKLKDLQTLLVDFEPKVLSIAKGQVGVMLDDFKSCNDYDSKIGSVTTTLNTLSSHVQGISKELKPVVTQMGKISNFESNLSVVKKADVFRGDKDVFQGWKDTDFGKFNASGNLYNLSKTLDTCLDQLSGQTNVDEPKFTPRLSSSVYNNVSSPLLVDNYDWVQGCDVDYDSYGLDKVQFQVPGFEKNRIFTNAIELHPDDEVLRMIGRFPFIEKKIYSEGLMPHKVFEYCDKRNRELMTSVKDFDSSDVLTNFDEYLKGFWRNCQRLHVDDHMCIKYSLFEHLDTVSKTVCTNTLDPTKCQDISVYKYMSDMRKILLPLNDISSARIAFKNFNQKDMPLDLYFEKKLGLFKRCCDGELRSNDYLDFYQQFCDNLTHKNLAFEVRKMVKRIKITDLAIFRKNMIDLGETFYQSALSNQIDDENKECLITQSMVNNLKEGGVKVEVASVQKQTSELVAQTGEALSNNDNNLYGESENEDDLVFVDDSEFEEMICAAQHEIQSCFWCLENGHFLKDCTKLKAKQPAHINSRFHPLHNRQTSNQGFVNQPNFRGRFYGRAGAQGYRRMGASYQRGGFRGNFRGNGRGVSTSPYISRGGYGNYRGNYSSSNNFMRKVSQVDESEAGGTPDIGEVAAICFDPIEGFLNDFM